MIQRRTSYSRMISAGAIKTAFRFRDGRAGKAIRRRADVSANVIRRVGVSSAIMQRRQDWYKRAADLGDREALCSLAMLRISGRGGPVNREDGAKLLASFRKKLGRRRRPIIWRIAYLDGRRCCRT